MTLSDPSIPLIAAAVLFLTICLLALGLLVYFKQLAYRRRLVEKLNAHDEGYGVFDDNSASLSLSETPSSPLLNFLNAIGMKFIAKDSEKAFDTKLKFLRAGYRGTNVATVFWGTKVLLAVTFPMTFFIVVAVLFQSLATKYVLLGTAFLVLLGMALPDFWLRIKTSGRKERIEKAFPDALDLLVVCVEAGMGLDASFNRVGKELELNHPDLSAEFKLMNLELRAGKPRRRALRNLAERTDIDDVSSLVTMLLQTDRFGTSVARSLRVFSETFRTTRYQKAEEIAAKIGTKLVFPLAICIFPSFFVVAIGPAAIQAWRMFMQ
jgi:tight adherence protein C